MTQAKAKFTSFAAYLAWSNDPANYREGRFELTDGELVEVPPESGINSTIGFAATRQPQRCAIASFSPPFPACN